MSLSLWLLMAFASSCAAFSTPAASAHTLSRVGRRSAAPVAQFGTGNFNPDDAPDRGVGGIVSPVAGSGYTGKDGNKLANEGGNPLAGAVVAATLSLPIVAIASIFLIAPGKQLPFNFLDGFYAPRVEEMRQVKLKVDNIEAEKATAAAKTKAAADAKAAEAAKAKAEVAAKK